MIKRLAPLLLLLFLLLGACTGPSPNPTQPQDESLSLVATTYPIYLFLSEVTRGADGVTVSPLINQSVSCLHNYTLSVKDMKVIEGADILFLNGAGLDDFVLDATHSNPDLSIVDCSTGLNLLPAYEEAHEPAQEAEEPDHDKGDWDPHYWMDPQRASTMVTNLSEQLSKLDPKHADLYASNAASAAETIRADYARLQKKLASLDCRKLITFHDGFAYFAEAFDLQILLAVEEEEGQEASAQVISKALSLIQTNQLPAIFTEEYSSDATAKAIAREAGVSVDPLSLIMSGPLEEPGVKSYLAAMEQNVSTVLGALS